MLKNFDECRWLYNSLLAQRRDTYRLSGKGVSLYDQHNALPEMKAARPSLKMVYSQVLQNVAVRVDLAFKAFFRRVRAGEKPGYPRFKGAGQYDSIVYPQYSKTCKLVGNKIRLPKIGDVKIILHRHFVGNPKTACIRRTCTGKWFVIITCECGDEELSNSKNTQIGIDVGLTTFATLSDGESVDNPRFFRMDENALAKARRHLSKAEKSSVNRVMRKKVVSRIYERITNRRHNFAHQESRKIVNKYQFIAVEDLSINRMVKNHHLAKSIMDAAWSQFSQFLSYKAESAGREFIAVNPAYTSQDCSGCGFRQVMPLSDRVYKCQNCNLEIGRDLNAALNILARGLASIGKQSVEAESSA